MVNEYLELENKVEIARLNHAVLDAELRIAKKKKEIEDIYKNIEVYKKLLKEKGA